MSNLRSINNTEIIDIDNETTLEIIFTLNSDFSTYGWMIIRNL